jgi:CelD/BcsL family acetyltransferase involved in cellulose biosynthesis
VTVNLSCDGVSAALGNDAAEFRIYSDLRQIAAISRQWEELLAIAPCNRAFASREWYAASCSKQGSWIPFLAAAFRGGTVLCILPLVLDHEDDTAKFPHHAADYNDVIARVDDPCLVADLLSHALASGQGGRRMVLSKLRPDSLCAGAVPLLCARSKVECGWREIDSYRYIRLPASFDDYLNSRSKAFRKNVRRKLRDLERDGLAMRELYPDEYEPASLPELLIALAVARHGAGCSFTRTVFVQSFLREVLPCLFRNRHLRAFALLDRERIVALDLCMVCPGGLATWNGGFLPEVEHYSPGLALFAFEIQQAIASGLHEFDFTRGEEAYKRSWANSSYAVGELELKP